MRNFAATVITLALAFGLAAVAQAEPPTKDQLAEFRQLVDGGHINRAELGEFLVQNRPGNTYTVKRRCNLAAAIKAGKYDWVNKDLTPENFPVPGGCVEGEEVEVRLFSPQELGQEDGIITTREAKAEMGKLECRPADWTVLLPLGEKYPELQLQRKFWIVGLGSAWRHPDGDVLVPVLVGRGGERDLSLGWDAPAPGGGWHSFDRLAASCE